MTEHTPTPWRIEEDEGYYYVIGHGIELTDWDSVMHNQTYYNHAPSRENAEFIVRAVNVHDALLAAAEAAVEAMGYLHFGAELTDERHDELVGGRTEQEWERATYDNLRAAISQARGEA